MDSICDHEWSIRTLDPLAQAFSLVEFCTGIHIDLFAYHCISGFSVSAHLRFLVYGCEETLNLAVYVTDEAAAKINPVGRLE